VSEPLLLARWVTGSHAYGVSTADSDRDYVELYVEPADHVTGLYRATNIQKIVNGEDVSRYPLRNWAHLVTQGNPNMVELLYIEPEWAHPMWTNYVLPVREHMLSKSAGFRFLGYAQSQTIAIERGMNGHVQRPELIEAHGYDTKYAYHALRIVREGLRLMKLGWLEFPLPDAEYLQAVRRGEVSKQEVLNQMETSIADLRSAIDATGLPRRVDMDRINPMLHSVYLRAWHELDFGRTDKV